MAIAVIGGLITSTLLTLVVVPVVYSIIDDLENFFKKKRKAGNHEGRKVEGIMKRPG
jgi:predicted RND superfamily exporter protein